MLCWKSNSTHTDSELYWPDVRGTPVNSEGVERLVGEEARGLEHVTTTPVGAEASLVETILHVGCLVV